MQVLPPPAPLGTSLGGDEWGVDNLNLEDILQSFPVEPGTPEPSPAAAPLQATLSYPSPSTISPALLVGVPKAPALAQPRAAQPSSPAYTGSTTSSPGGSATSGSLPHESDDDSDDGGKKKRKRAVPAALVEGPSGLEFMGLTNEHILTISSRDFDIYVDQMMTKMAITAEQQAIIKVVRRKIMDREYAVVGRKKKTMKLADMELRVQQLEQENAQLRQRLSHVEAENMSFRMASAGNKAANNSIFTVGARPQAFGTAAFLILLLSFGMFLNFNGPFSSGDSPLSSSGSPRTGRVLQSPSEMPASWFQRALVSVTSLFTSSSTPQAPPRSSSSTGSSSGLDHEQDELQCFTKAELAGLRSQWCPKTPAVAAAAR